MHSGGELEKIVIRRHVDYNAGGHANIMIRGGQMEPKLCTHSATKSRTVSSFQLIVGRLVAHCKSREKGVIVDMGYN